MKRTRSWVMMAISLLLTGSGQAYSQAAPGPVRLPKDIVTNVSYDATISAGQVYKFKISLQQGGTLVKVRFVPPKEEPVKNPTLTVTRASDLDAAINRSAKQQEAALKAAPLSLIVTVGSRQLSPLPDFSSGTAFTVQIDRSLSTSGAGEGALKNLTSTPLTGKVLVSSVKLDGLQTFKTNRDREQINGALGRMKNPDLFWSIYHTMQRHAANYPGGQSDYEKQYSARLQSLHISAADMAAVTNQIKPYEAQIKAKVADKSLTQVTLQQSIQPAKINALLKFTQKPAQQLKVATPQKPATAPPPSSGATITASSMMGKNWSFESKNYPGYYVRHLQAGGQMSLAPVSNAAERNAATFRVTPGIADNQNVSLQSVTFPWMFITLVYSGTSGGAGILYQKWETQVPNYQTFWRWQTFVVRPGLADATMVSFESLWNPSYYLRHRDFKMYVEPCTDNLAKSDATFKPVAPVNQTATGPKYRIRLLGIESKRCADDVGWELGCDREEPYIVWTCFGPSWDRTGATEAGRNVRKNDFYMYEQDTDIYGSGPDGKDAAYVEYPLFFIYMVIEADPGGPGRAKALDRWRTLVGAVKATLLADVDWQNVATTMIEFFSGVADACMTLNVFRDDKHAPRYSAFDEENLLWNTSGSQPLPVEKPLNECAGRYNGLAVIKGEVENGWNVYYTILRQTN